MKLVLLALLYLVEGLPFGLQTQALPLYLRELGFSLGAISSLALLSTPWLLKPLWSPLVDRYGTRRRWILALLAALLVTALLGTRARTILAIQVLLFALNFLSATLDIAVDGLAVDLLGPRELGPGNAVQVVGYKAGMILGGWVLGQVAAGHGLGALFGFMGVPILAALIATAVWREAPRARTAERDSLAAIGRTLWRAVRAPAGRWVLVCVATYKVGESLIDPMFKLFLKDAGFAKTTVLTWTAGYGLAASMLGSTWGGWLATRMTLRNALLVTAALRVGPLVAEWVIASGSPNAGPVIATIVAENFLGGALTTVMFAFMMSSVDRRIGATHFTVLAGIEVLGKMPASAASGFLAETMGYAQTFGLGVALSVGYLPLVWWGTRRLKRTNQGSGDGAD